MLGLVHASALQRLLIPGIDKAQHLTGTRAVMKGASPMTIRREAN